MKEIRKVIVDAIKQIAEEQSLMLTGELTDATVLLESGLDSLAFAILVADLETSLGYDPFALMDTPVYPKTLLDFVTVYQQFMQHRII